MQYVSPGCTAKIIPGYLAIARPAASSRIPVQAEPIGQRQAKSAAKTLEKEFIQQTGADQPGIKRGSVPEIIFTNIESNDPVRLDANRNITAAQPYFTLVAGLCAGKQICFLIAVNRQVGFIVDSIFEERELPIRLPVNPGNRNSGCAAEAYSIKASALKINERPRQCSMPIVVPG